MSDLDGSTAALIWMWTGGVGVVCVLLGLGMGWAAGWLRASRQAWGGQHRPSVRPEPAAVARLQGLVDRARIARPRGVASVPVTLRVDPTVANAPADDWPYIVVPETAGRR